MPDCKPLVIIIEDHPLARLAQRMLCEQAGYRVVEVSNLADVATCDAGCEGRRVIIADFDMGTELTGVQLARALMRRVGMPIPTLVLSATVGTRAQQEADAQQMKLLAKPTDDGQLIEWITGALADSARRLATR